MKLLKDSTLIAFSFLACKNANTVSRKVEKILPNFSFTREAFGKRKLFDSGRFFTGLQNKLIRPVICRPTEPEPTEADSIEITIGTVLSSPSFELEVCEVLGSGAFGKVYSVVDRETGRKMAMKVLNNQTEEEKLDNEAEIEVLEHLSKRKLAKSYLPHYYGSFIFEDYSCILMEQLDGSLLDYMEQQTEPPSVAVCVYLAYQILSSLKELNDAGYGHTDLKLNNILFENTKDWKVKVIDFGLAPTLKDMRRSEEYNANGTLPYQAPEMTFNLSCDEKVDVWSVGCLLFEVYTGMDLFTAADKETLVRQLDHLLGLPSNVDSFYRFDRFFQVIEEEIPQLLVNSREFADVTVDMPYKHRKLKKMIQYGVNMRRDGIAKTEDIQLMTFIIWLLQVDKEKRPNAEEALKHKIFNKFSK